MTTTMLALLHRDVRVARRELHYFLLRVAIQPLLFTFIFGYVMPRLGIVQRGYTSMLLPGILGLSMTLSSMQAVALPLVIDFGWSKEIEDRLLAPISIAGVGIEKIIVGILQAIIAGLVVLPLAWLMMGAHLSMRLTDLAQLIMISLLSSWLFAAFGMVVGTVAAPQQIASSLPSFSPPLSFFAAPYIHWPPLHFFPGFNSTFLFNRSFTPTKG